MLKLGHCKRNGNSHSRLVLRVDDDIISSLISIKSINVDEQSRRNTAAQGNRVVEGGNEQNEAGGASGSDSADEATASDEGTLYTPVL